MNSNQLLIVLLGAVVGGGIALFVYSLRAEVDPNKPVEPSSLLPTLKRLGTRLPLAIGAGLLILLFTRWVVLAGATGLLVFFAPSLFGGARSERIAIARLEGLAAWTESLRDTIAGAVGLEQAIPATANAAAPAIRDELIALSDRLRVRTPLPVALQLFADDLDDSSADLIVAALMLNSQLRGPGLRDVLTSLARSAREELEMRRRVNAGRASTRRSVQIVMGITVAFVLGLTLFNREYVEPYSGAVGQVVLLVILGLFAAGFAWMRRLAAFEVPERFLFATGLHRAGGTPMTTVMLVGACVGLGLLLLVLQYDTGRASGASELARLDAARARTRRTANAPRGRARGEGVPARPQAGRPDPRGLRGPRLEPAGRDPRRPGGDGRHRRGPPRHEPALRRRGPVRADGDGRAGDLLLRRQRLLAGVAGPRSAPWSGWPCPRCSSRATPRSGAATSATWSARSSTWSR